MEIRNFKIGCVSQWTTFNSVITYLDSLSRSGCYFGQAERRFNSGNTVCLLREGEKLSYLGGTVGLRVGKFSFEFLYAVCMGLLALFSASCQGDMELAGEGA